MASVPELSNQFGGPNALLNEASLTPLVGQALAIRVRSGTDMKRQNDTVLGTLISVDGKGAVMDIAGTNTDVRASHVVVP